MIANETRDLVELVKFDYEHSLRLIDGLVRVSIGLRTIAFAGCLGLLTAAMQTDQALLALFALATAVVFGVQDAYHGWLYAEARRRVARMEGLLDAYYRELQGEASEARRTQLLKNLRKHRIGSRVSLRAPLPPKSLIRQAEWRREASPLVRIASRLRIAWLVMAANTLLREARPRVVYLLLYPLLTLISLGGLIALTIRSDAGSGSQRPVRICIACVAKVENSAFDRHWRAKHGQR